MSVSRQLSLLVLAVIAAACVLSSCNGSRAETSTLDIYWSHAKDGYYAGDFIKSLHKLDQIMETQNQYNSRALPMSLIISSGLADGYIEIAEYYIAGAKMNKGGKALDFRRKAGEYRSMAAHLVLQFAESARKMDNIPGSVVSLAFPPASGSAGFPPGFKRIAAGIELTQADEDATLNAALKRSVLLAVCRAVGAPNDTAKAMEVLQKGTLLPRPTFMGSVAESLKNQAQLYSRNKLDDPTKMAMLQQLAQQINAAAGLPPMVVQVSSDTAQPTGGKKRKLSAAAR